MRTSAEFLSDLQPVIDRIAGGPMNNERIDVLAVMESLAKRAESRARLPLKAGLVNHNAAEAAAINEARAAVAELVEAAKGVVEMENEPRFLYGEIESLRAALAKVGAP